MRVKIWLMAGVLLAGGTVARAQGNNTVKDDLFAGTEKFAANATSVTEVNMDPDSLGMVGGSNSTRAKRTVLSVVHTYTYDKPGMYNMADVDAFRNKLNTGDWHCSVHVRELKTGESTDVCQKRRTDGLEESAIITVEPKELTFIHTIRRPGAPGKPGSAESWMASPFEAWPGATGMPMSAWAAEMRAQGAEMRALAAVDRAEMQAMMPGFRMNLFGDGLAPMPAIDEERLRDLTRRLNGMPRMDLRRVPPPPAAAPVPSVPQGGSGPKAPASPVVPQSHREAPVPPQPLSAVVYAFLSV